MEENNLTAELIFNAANLLIFTCSATFAFLIQKYLKGRLVTQAFLLLLISSIFAIAIKGISEKETSKYKTFGVKRCATKREILSQFRVWSKVVHPDKMTVTSDIPFTYPELDELKDFLTTEHSRTFYDKFDRIFERDNFDETQIKNVHSYLFQRKLFQYLNMTFVWVFVSFLLSKYLKQLEITNFLLKILMGKSFVVIYYLYSQNVEECSLLDSAFGFLTISQQIYYCEFVVSMIFGFVTAIFFENFKEEKEKMKKSVCEVKQILDKTSGDAPALKELKENVKKFSDFLNN